MTSQTLNKTAEKAANSRRGPRLTADQVLADPAVKALRETILAGRAATGTTDVTQAEVDQAAEILLRTGLPPYPTLVRVVVGGSLSTVGPKLRDWWQRFGTRSLGVNSPGLTPATKLDLQLRLLVSQLEATLREKLQEATDPLQALTAAAQLGEQQGLKVHLEAVMADRDRLRQQLEAMTFKVAQLETQLKAQAAARHTEQSALEVGLDRLSVSLEHLSTQLAPTSQRSSADLDQLTTQVRRLISGLARSPRSSHPRARARASQAPRRRPARISHTRTRSAVSGKPAREGPRKRGAPQSRRPTRPSRR
jgi:hypothetical protein